MTKITLSCKGAVARARVEGSINQGMMGIPVQVQWDEAWQGLRKILKLRCGDAERAVELDEDGAALLPWDCLLPGYRLDCGLDGWDEEGQLRIPSNWACCALVQPSVADCDGNPGALLPPSPEALTAVYQRIEETEAAMEALARELGGQMLFQVDEQERVCMPVSEEAV